MRFRELFGGDPGGNNPSQGGPGGESLMRLRQEGDAFAAAGDDAISRALSGDSEAFLKASPQETGE